MDTMDIRQIVRCRELPPECREAIYQGHITRVTKAKELAIGVWQLLATILQCGLTEIDLGDTLSRPEKTLTVTVLLHTCRDNDLIVVTVNVCGTEDSQFREPGTARWLYAVAVVGVIECIPEAALHEAGTTLFMLFFPTYLPTIAVVTEGALGDSGNRGNNEL
jgi:hypothetical protein